MASSHHFLTSSYLIPQTRTKIMHEKWSPSTKLRVRRKIHELSSLSGTNQCDKSASHKSNRLYVCASNSSRNSELNSESNSAPASDNEGPRDVSTEPLGRAKAAPPSGTTSLTLEDVNPIGLGRRSRQLFDEVWKRLIELGQLSRPQQEQIYDDEYSRMIRGPICDFVAPNAEFTTVLVAGATGRVGRILVRKLLLRGYTVKVLVRKIDAETLEKLPRAVEQVLEADLGDAVSVQKAVLEATANRPAPVASVGADGIGASDAVNVAARSNVINKVIFCAAARSAITGDLNRVDNLGVANLAKAFLDHNHRLALKRSGRSAKNKITLAKFSKEKHRQGWRLKEGLTTTSSFNATSALLSSAADANAALYDGGMDAEIEFGENGNGIFKGYVYTKGGYLDLWKNISLPENLALDRFEGVLLKACGDGKPYFFLLKVKIPKEEGQGGAEAESPGEAQRAGEKPRVSAHDRARIVRAYSSGGEEEEEMEGEEEEEEEEDDSDLFVSYVYAARFNTRPGFSTIRIPFSAFRPVSPGPSPFLSSPPSSPLIPPLDPRFIASIGIRFEPTRKSGNNFPQNGNGLTDAFSFKLELDFIKAFPSGEETDFVLVSCTGAGVEKESSDKILKAKQSGESAIRNCGLGYTIVRAGRLIEEAGGQKALVFDQGNRITEGISCADVADVCVKALHDPMARNKSFDVCYEYSDRSGLYELVAHLPDKSNNYLTPALALLEKNT